MTREDLNDKKMFFDCIASVLCMNISSPTAMLIRVPFLRRLYSRYDRLLKFFLGTVALSANLFSRSSLRTGLTEFRNLIMDMDIVIELLFIYKSQEVIRMARLDQKAPADIPIPIPAAAPPTESGVPLM